MKCHSAMRSFGGVALRVILLCLPVTDCSADIVAHYPFDTADLWADIGGNGLSLDLGGSWNGGSSTSTNLAIAGSGSCALARNPMNSNSGAFIGWTPNPPALLSTLAGSFTVSLWIKTLDDSGFPNDFAFN